MCLTVAILCLGWFGWNWIATEVDQRWANYELQAALRGQSPSVPDFLQAEMARVTGEQAETASPQKVPDAGPRPRILPGGLIGRVTFL
jgi:hypothetical protein